MRVYAKGLRKACKRVKMKKWLLVMFFFLILLSSVFAETFRDKIPDYVAHVENKDEEQFIHDITESMIIEQTFSSAHDFDYIALSFSDHDEVIAGETSLSLIEAATGERVYYEELSNKEITYAQPVKLQPAAGGKKGIEYLVKIEGKGTAETGLGIFGYPSEETPAVVNGEKGEYVVSVGIYSYTGIFKYLFTAVYFIILFMVAGNFIFITQIQPKTEYMFLCAAVPVGMIFLMFLSSNTVHDGNTHLAKIFHYSNIILGNDQNDSYGHIGLSETEADVFYEVRRDLGRNDGILYEYYNAHDKFGRKSDFSSSQVICEYRETSASSFLEYIPAIVAVTLGRLINGSVYFNLLLAKIFSFVVYILICFCAVRTAPFLKNALAITALIPMNLYQATGLTYDSTIFACILLAFAYFLKALQSILKKREILILALLSVIIGCCKGGFYLPVLLLLILLPAKIDKKSTGKWKICFGSWAAGAAGFLFTAFHAFLPYIKDIFMISSVSPSVESTAIMAQQIIPGKEAASYGILFAVVEPKGFIQLLLHTVTEKASFYLGGLIGYRMAWAYRYMDFIVVVPFLILLIIALARTTEEKGIKLSSIHRLFCALIFSIEFLGFHILMLLETPIDNTFIQGVQGRYFLPLIPLVMFLLYNAGRMQDANGERRLYLYYNMAVSIYIFAFLKIFILL